MIGKRFGRLVVVARTSKSFAWLCRCDCGKKVVVTRYRLESGQTRSCGCYRLEAMRARATRHGMRRTPIYDVWSQMIQRCTNPKNKQYDDYGGRGITVCARWMKFENFARDMGERPLGGILDRKKNAVGYQPDNCRWVNRQVSNVNRRNVAIVEHDGKSYTLPELAKVFGISVRAMQRRYKKNPDKLS